MQSKLKLNVKGKNIERFIKRLNKNNINILKIDYLKYNEINIIIYKIDYDKIMNLKTIYEIEIIDSYGIIKYREVIKKYKFLYLIIVINVFVLIFLSNIIFDVEVVYNDKKVRKTLLNELEEYNIKKYKFKKNYDEIQNIKKSILSKYQDSIEWLEIENVGTKYIVRLEERIKKNNLNDYINQNLVAKKSGIIKKISVKSGNVIKDVNDYVNKNDVIISGDIYLNEEIKKTTQALGKVYAEVWYNVKVEYPFYYNEVKELNEYNNVYLIKIFNKEIGFNLNKFKDKKVNDEIILSSNFLPIYLIKQKQMKIEKIESLLTVEQARIKALNKALDKIKSNLKNDEKILDFRILNMKVLEDKVEINVFFTVYEDITSYSKIEGE